LQVGVAPCGEAPALLRQLRRALEGFLETDRAEALQERVVPRDGARHGCRVDAVAGHAAAAAVTGTAPGAAIRRAAAAAPPALLRRECGEELGRPARRRPAA